MEDWKIFFLKNLDIYNWLSEDEHMRIAKNSYECSKFENDVIYSPENEDSNIYVLKKWEVELYHLKNGKKIVFDILVPWDVFWNFDLKSKYPTHYAASIRSCYLCITPLEEFLRIISAHPELMLVFMQKMAKRLSDYEDKINSNNWNASEKILYELKRLKKKKSKNFFWKFFNLPLKITHEKISSITWLNRITVTRTVSTLQKDWKIIIWKNWTIDII